MTHAARCRPLPSPAARSPGPARLGRSAARSLGRPAGANETQSQTPRVAGRRRTRAEITLKTPHSGPAATVFHHSRPITIRSEYFRN